MSKQNHLQVLLAALLLCAWGPVFAASPAGNSGTIGLALKFQNGYGELSQDELYAILGYGGTLEGQEQRVNSDVLAKNFQTLLSTPMFQNQKATLIKIGGLPWVKIMLTDGRTAVFDPRTGKVDVLVKAQEPGPAAGGGHFSVSDDGSAAAAKAGASLAAGAAAKGASAVSAGAAADNRGVLGRLFDFQSRRKNKITVPAKKGKQAPMVAAKTKAKAKTTPVEPKKKSQKAGPAASSKPAAKSNPAKPAAPKARPISSRTAPGARKPVPTAGRAAPRGPATGPTVQPAPPTVVNRAAPKPAPKPAPPQSSPRAVASSALGGLFGAMMGLLLGGPFGLILGVLGGLFLGALLGSELFGGCAGKAQPKPGMAGRKPIWNPSGLSKAPRSGLPVAPRSVPGKAAVPQTAGR